MKDDVFTSIAQSIIEDEPEEAERLTRQSLEAINKRFVTGVSYVGDQFSCGKMFLPDLVLAGDAMKREVLQKKWEKSDFWENYYATIRDGYSKTEGRTAHIQFPVGIPGPKSA